MPFGTDAPPLLGYLYITTHIEVLVHVVLDQLVKNYLKWWDIQLASFSRVDPLNDLKEQIIIDQHRNVYK